MVFRVNEQFGYIGVIPYEISYLSFAFDATT